ncbi:MAG: PsiF family protein [Pseudomonadota bacterium]|nr:PsiF family protein [Pseudomonadota bacterium]
MKQLITLAAALALAISTSAFAASSKEAPGMAASGAMTKQQSKMGDCNKEAGDKKGDERKAFMKTCLSGGSAMAAPAKPMTQQDKMKKCNTDATGKKGDERKSFMKECLSA